MTSETYDGPANDPTTSALSVEQHGLNVIPEDERKGVPRDLFWPWCAANISVLGVAYGAYILGMGVNLWQALAAGVAGVVFSFFLVGLVSVAGTKGSAPTMVLSRAAFGVQGNKLPGLVSYLLLVGWETILAALATLATATIFGELGWGSGNVAKLVGFAVTAALVVLAGVLGFDMIMRLQRWLTRITVAITVGYILLTLDELDFGRLTSTPAGSATTFLGGLLLVMTAFGLGWVNSAADYSRYLPRHSSGPAIMFWSTFGSALPSLLLVVYGVLLVGSKNEDFMGAMYADPIGALATLLPTWYLVPFALVAILGLVSGAVLDIYSSGLTLLSLGLPTPRWVAAAVDGVIMIAGTIYIVWFAQDFRTPFTAFLLLLGVPISAWCGVFVADLLSRREYVSDDLYRSSGRYGAFNWAGIGSMVASTVLGWGLVVPAANAGYASADEAPGWLAWPGYLLEPFGLGGKTGPLWPYANLGVLVALVVPAVVYLVAGRATIRRQDLR